MGVGPKQNRRFASPASPFRAWNRINRFTIRCRRVQRPPTKVMRVSVGYFCAAASHRRPCQNPLLFRKIKTQRNEWKTRAIVSVFLLFAWFTSDGSHSRRPPLRCRPSESSRTQLPFPSILHRLAQKKAKFPFLFVAAPHQLPSLSLPSRKKTLRGGRFPRSEASDSFAVHPLRRKFSLSSLFILQRFQGV